MAEKYGGVPETIRSMHTALREITMIWKISHIGLLLTLLHSERPKLHTILAFLSAIGLNGCRQDANSRM